MQSLLLLSIYFFVYNRWKIRLFWEYFLAILLNNQLFFAWLNWILHFFVTKKGIISFKKASYLNFSQSWWSASLSLLLKILLSWNNISFIIINLIVISLIVLIIQWFNIKVKGRLLVSVFIHFLFNIKSVLSAFLISVLGLLI